MIQWLLVRREGRDLKRTTRGLLSLSDTFTDFRTVFSRTDYAMMNRRNKRA